MLRAALSTTIAEGSFLPLLLKNSTNINVTEDMFELAAYNGREDDLRSLATHSRNDDIPSKWLDIARLYTAAASGESDRLKDLLERGVKCNFSDSEGYAPLAMAAWEGHESAVQMLLSAGADPNIGKDQGCVALKLAAKQGYYNIVELLVKAGASIDVINKSGSTPTAIAKLKGYWKVFKFLERCEIEQGLQQKDANSDDIGPQPPVLKADFSKS